jgi:hypothetical protein
MLFHWRWYYHTTTAPLWAAIVLLLAVPRANRTRQAWLILIPLLFVLVLWRVPIMWLDFIGDPNQILGWLIVTWTMAWAMVWLMGHWLAGRYRLVTWFSIVVVMLAAGVLSFFCSGQEDASFPSFAIFYSVVVVSTPAAMLLAGGSCRKRFSGKSFGLWLLLWIVVVTVGLPLAVLLGVSVIMQLPLADLLGSLLAICVVMGVSAGIMYVINLPFVILGMYSTFYRSRLEAMFRGRPIAEVSPFAIAPADARIEPEGGLP